MVQRHVAVLSQPRRKFGCVHCQLAQRAYRAVHAAVPCSCTRKAKNQIRALRRCDRRRKRELKSVHKPCLQPRWIDQHRPARNASSKAWTPVKTVPDETCSVLKLESLSEVLRARDIAMHASMHAHPHRDKLTALQDSSQSRWDMRQRRSVRPLP